MRKVYNISRLKTMAVKKKVSKNNIEARGKGARIKNYNGQDVFPVLLIEGKKKFMAAQTAEGKLVMVNGQYVPYASIQ